MNRRQKMKRLKSQNDLMRRIIRDNEDMERTFHLWTDGLQIKQTKILVEEYKCERIIPYSLRNNDKYAEVVEREVKTDLCHEIRDCVSIETIDLGWEKAVRGSILVGKVR